MADFFSVQRFINDANAARCESRLTELVDKITHELGFNYFALVQHVDLKSRKPGRCVALWTYPQAWVDEYIERGLVADDPVHLASHRTNVGFSWDDVAKLIPETPRHRQVRSETVRAGLAGGFTVPANIPGEANGSCSFALARGGSLAHNVLPAAQLAGSFAFSAARKLLRSPDASNALPPALTTRQLECLVLVGRGKTDGEIATILGIAEDTVTEHLDEGRRRYDVVKRSQLLVRAIFDGQIALSDVLH